MADAIDEEDAAPSPEGALEAKQKQEMKELRRMGITMLDTCLY